MPNPVKYLALFVLGGVLAVAAFYTLIASAFGGFAYLVFGLGLMALPGAGIYFIMGLNRGVNGPPRDAPTAPDIETEYETWRKYQTGATIAVIMGGLSTVLFYALLGEVRSARFDTYLVIVWVTVYFTLAADLFGWRFFVWAKLYRDRQAAFDKANQEGSPAKTPGLVVGIVEPPEPIKPPALADPAIKKLVVAALITINVAGAAIGSWAAMASSREAAVRSAQSDARSEAARIRKLQAPIAGWHWYEDTKLGYKFPYPPAWGEPVVNTDKLASQQIITVTFSKQPSPTLTLQPKGVPGTPYVWPSGDVDIESASLFDSTKYSRGEIARRITAATGNENLEVTGTKTVVLANHKTITQAIYRYRLSDWMRTCYAVNPDPDGRLNYTDLANPACNLNAMANDITLSLKWFPKIDRDYGY